MNITETIKAIHVLACLRHFDADPAKVQVVIGPWAEAGHAVDGSGPGEPRQEAAERCQWSAQVRLGGGAWGHNVGPGATVEEALANLLRGYVAAHDVVNERRASAFGRLPALTGFRVSTAVTVSMHVTPEHAERLAQEAGALAALVAERVQGG